MKVCSASMHSNVYVEAQSNPLECLRVKVEPTKTDQLNTNDNVNLKETSTKFEG